MSVATIVKKLDRIGKHFLTDLIQASIYGQCYHLAIALHHGLGWPLVGLIDNGKIIHAGVRSPEGKLWDGRGKVSEKEFVKPFSKNPPVIRDITEDDLQTTGTVQKHAVEVMQEKAQAVWPKLPWKQKTREERVVAFADELEALSRKHKLWVCGMFLRCCR